MSEEVRNDDQLQETLEQAEPANPEPEEHVGETEPQAEAQEQPRASQSNQENIRQLRLRAEQLERERDEYMRYIQEQRAQQQKPQEQEPQLSPDDLVEWKYVQNEIKKVKDELNAYKQQAASSSAETKLNMQYNDFRSVVTEQNIARLRDEYPELAATISSNQDLYTKGAAAYTLIKRLGIAQEPQYVKSHTKVERNLQKPRAAESLGTQTGQSPLDQANMFSEGLTDELRKKLWKEMKDAQSYS